MPRLQMIATFIKISVKNSHSEFIYFEIENKNNYVNKIKHLLKEGEEIVVQDNPKNRRYPATLEIAGEISIYR